MKSLLLLLLMLPMACSSAPLAPSASAAGDSTSAEESATQLRDDIGTMLLVGFRGTAIDSTHHLFRDLTRYHVGSVILFDYDAPSAHAGRNIASPQQLRTLCQQLRALNPDLLIGIDQEGGRVSRLKASKGFPLFASAKQCAAWGDDSVRATALRTAHTLASLGINLNFAPVADVDVNPQCPIIGKVERSFSANPQRVVECCRIWIEAQREYQVGSCLKHFPGHGSARSDTHMGMADVSATWQRAELEPYRALAADSTLVVMTAHVVNRQLDPSGLPASLSPSITALLRDSLGFQGIICTDDLAMGAIVRHYSLEQTIVLALAAGADLLCLSNNGEAYNPDLVPQVVAIIEGLVERGEVSPDRLHRSAERVRRLQRVGHF